MALERTEVPAADRGQRLQRESGLTADGIVGPRNWTALLDVGR